MRNITCLSLLSVPLLSRPSFHVSWQWTAVPLYHYTRTVIWYSTVLQPSLQLYCRVNIVVYPKPAPRMANDLHPKLPLPPPEQEEATVLH